MSKETIGLDFSIIFTELIELRHKISILESKIKELESKTDNLDERTFPMTTIGSTEI